MIAWWLVAAAVAGAPAGEARLSLDAKDAQVRDVVSLLAELGAIAEARTELQLAYDLLGRKGLAQAAVVRKELAAAVPALAALAGEISPQGVRLAE